MATTKPVVIDGIDNDSKRVMHPDRQQGYLDALTELSRQWGIRIKNMQCHDDVQLQAVATGYEPDGHYNFTESGRISWDLDPDKCYNIEGPDD